VGCGVAAAGAAEASRTLALTEAAGPVTRTYWLSRPADYNPMRLYKVIVGLGAPASAVDAVRQQVRLQGGGAAGAADEIFVYPMALVRNFGSWGTVAAWELGPGARDSNAAGVDDLAFIDAMLDDVTRHYCVDASRVFLVGFGWGSDFANALACVRGNRVRAIAGATNNGDYYVTSPPVACQGSVSTWIFQGKGDTRLGLAAGMTTLGFWRNQHACSTRTQALTVVGPSGNEDCFRYLGCTAGTRWCAYDASFGSSAPSYLGREALGYFRGM
jgi:polyhydroxybutyrate depolymerase